VIKNKMISALVAVFAATSIAFTPQAAIAGYAANASSCSGNEMKLNVDVSAANGFSVSMPVILNASGSITVDWADGSTNIIKNPVAKSFSNIANHTYTSAGQYTVTIAASGTMNTFGGTGGSRSGKAPIQSVNCWGSSLGLVSLQNAFFGDSGLVSVPDKLPGQSFADPGSSSSITSLAGAFEAATKFNSSNVSTWGTSAVTDFSRMFYGATVFNSPVGQWKTGNSLNMAYMFSNATAFNQPINTAGSSWDVSKSCFTGIFQAAPAFNQPLSNWDVHSCTDFTETFAAASVFNQNLSNWNTSSATNMTSMFQQATKFNNGGAAGTSSAPLTAVAGSKWDVSHVKSMENMFALASSFNQDLSSWTTTSLTSLWATFSNTNVFNQNLTNWDVSHVTTFNSTFSQSAFNNLGQPLTWTTGTTFPIYGGYMFYNNRVFNQPFGNGWVTSSFTNMASMFKMAVKFNQDISGWNTGNVTDFSGMFNSASVFNSDISAWNVAKGTTMASMFTAAKLFNQDISNWDFPASRNLNNFLDMSGLSKLNYGKFIKSMGARTRTSAPLAAQSPQQIFDTGMTLGAFGLIAPCDSLDASVVGAQANRLTLMSAPNAWVVKDSIPDTCTPVTTSVTIKIYPTSGSHVFGANPALITYAGPLPDGDSLTAPITCLAVVASTNAAITSGSDADTTGTTYVTKCSSTAATTSLGNSLDFTATGSYKVTQAPLTITANDFSKQYGKTYVFDTAHDFNASGLVNGNTIASVSLGSTGASTIASVSGGPYAVPVSNAVFASGTAANYSITYRDGTFSVTKAPLTITAANKSKKVGQTIAFNTGLGSSGLLTRYYQFGYSLDSIDTADTVSPKRKIGETKIPATTRLRNAFDVTYSAYKSGACPGVVGAIDFTNVLADPGTGSFFRGNCGSGTSYRYNFVQYSTGFITPTYSGQYHFCSQTDDGAYLKIARGTGNDVVIDDWNFQGAAANCNKTSDAIDLTAGVSYPIDFWGLQGAQDEMFKLKWLLPNSGHTATDYSSYSVIPVEFFSNTNTDYTVDGLVNGDTVSNITLSSEGAAAPASAGQYAIVPVLASNTNTNIWANYEVTYVNGNLNVEAEPASPPATIIARSHVVVYGQPSLDVSSDFDVSGATPATTPLCAIYIPGTNTLATGRLNVGSYDIRCGSNSNPGTDKFISGVYKVIPRPVTLTLSDLTKNYGDDLNSANSGIVGVLSSALESGDTLDAFNSSAFGASQKSIKRGIVNALTADALDVLTIETATAHGLRVGDTIALTGLSAAMPVQTGLYLVTSVLSTTKFTVEGNFVSADVAYSTGTDADLQFAKQTGLEATADVGTYTLTVVPQAPCASGLIGNGLSNYEFTCVAATLTVNPRVVTVAPVAATLAAGEKFTGSIEYTLSTFANGENEQSAKNYVAPTCSSNYTTSMPAPTTFSLVCTQAQAANYVFTYQTGLLHTTAASAPNGGGSGGGTTTPSPTPKPTPVPVTPFVNVVPPIAPLSGGNIAVNLGTYNLPISSYLVTVLVAGQSVQVIELGKTETNFNVEVNPQWAGKEVKIIVKAMSLTGANVSNSRSLVIPGYFKNIVVVSSGANSSKYVVLSFTADSAKITPSQLTLLKAAGIASSDVVKVVGYVHPWSTLAHQYEVSLARALKVRDQLKSLMKAKVVSASGVGATVSKYCAPVKNRCVVVQVKKVK
jgi:surface protein